MINAICDKCGIKMEIADENPNLFICQDCEPNKIFHDLTNELTSFIKNGEQPSYICSFFNEDEAEKF